MISLRLFRRPADSGSARRLPIFFDDQSRYLDSFGLLLVVTIASIMLLSLVDMTPKDNSTLDRWEEVIAAVMVGWTLLLALRSSGVAKRWQRVADIVVVLMVTFLVIVALLASVGGVSPVHPATAPILVVLVGILAPVVVMRRLLTHREVRRSTLLGAISAYLLIGIAYYYVYLVLNTTLSAPFFGSPQSTTSFMYFSLGTISTAGAGSLEPFSDLARMLTNSEAIVGQVYLVVFVAMLVGLFAAGRGRTGPSVDS